MKNMNMSDVDLFECYGNLIKSLEAAIPLVQDIEEAKAIASFHSYIHDKNEKFRSQFVGEASKDNE